MSTPLLVASTSPSPLWYLTRGTGIVALLLLTVSVVLGVLNVSRWATPGWPRFATAGLHRYVSLMVIAVLAIHIVTAEADTFAPVGWLAVVVPFASSYRPIWLGLGTLAFDLLLAIVITSLLRERIGYRAWRTVHWAAYLSWPVALVHGLGTGTDARLHWVTFLTVICVAAVLVAGGWRLGHDWQSRPAARMAAGSAAVVTAVVVGIWTVTGPLRPGWARRAGTPKTLLAAGASSSRAPAGSNGPSTSSPVTPPTQPPQAAPAGVPAAPFRAELTGQLTQSGPDARGQVSVQITAEVIGPLNGSFDVLLRGASDDGGVSMEASSVTFGPTTAPTAYRGRVVALDGEQIVASVTSGSGQSLTLAANLRIDPESGQVHGTLRAEPASGVPGDR